MGKARRNRAVRVEGDLGPSDGQGRPLRPDVVVEVRERSPTGRAVLRGGRTAECKLDWYARRALITDRQHAAGLRYRQQFERAGLAPRLTAAYGRLGVGGGRGGPGTAQDLTPMMLDGRRKYLESRRAVGAVLAGLLDAVCCEDLWAGDYGDRRGWGERTGIDMLREALSALADHYGV